MTLVRRPLHTARVIKMAMEQGPEGPPAAKPERRYADVQGARG
jgi:hypothetical protein